MRSSNRHESRRRNKHGIGLARERLLRLSPAALSDAELLAIVLGNGNATGGALDIANRCIADAGGLRQLCELPLVRLKRLNGVGEAAFAVLRAAIELTSRCFEEEMRLGPTHSNSQRTRKFLQTQLASERREVFGCMFLDSRHRLIAFERLFTGTIDHAVVHPRELIRATLEHDAVAVILVHNHPSGDPEPSAADHDITDRLSQALGSVEVRVLDHIVVAGNRSVSFADRGWL